MLDTVKLQSPYLGASVASEIERSCIRRMAVRIDTGESLYEITSGSLSGSWDSRVSVRVMREEWRDGRLVRCPPYVLLEGSVHKALLGHNVVGGPESLSASCQWLCVDVSRRLGVELPNGREWFVRRADWAECYELPDFAAVEEYMWGLNSAQYPRRSVVRYGQESIFAAGRTTAVKAYHKGLEFAKHDYKRLKSRMDAKQLIALQLEANRTLRWEVSVKAKKLDEDFTGKPSVSQVSDSYLENLHYREVRRLVREGEAEVKTVRRQKDVRDRLLEVYDQRKAGLLLGTWHQLVTLGEKETRRYIADRTYYRHKKHLIEAGVSWIGSDVLVVPKVSSLPVDFSPTKNDPRRYCGEDPYVTAKLSRFRAA